MIVSAHFLFDVNCMFYTLPTNSKHKRKIYSVIFREDLYAINWRYVTETQYSFVQLQHLYPKMSFLVIKRLIKQIRFSKKNQNNYNKKNLQLKCNMYSNRYKIIFQLIAIVLAFTTKPSECIYPFLQILKPDVSSYIVKRNWSNNNKIPYYGNDGTKKKKKIISSIHTIFLFIQNRCFSCSLMLQSDIMCCIHPEIIFRIFRQYIQDTNMLHILRQELYHIGKYLQTSFAKFSQYTNQINFVLWNLYALEFDKFMVAEFSKMQSIPQISSFFFVYKTSIYKKKNKHELLLFPKMYSTQMLHLHGHKNERPHFQANQVFWYGFLACHYIRYVNFCIASIQQTEEYFVPLFYHRFNKFCRRRMGRFTQYIFIYNLQCLHSCLNYLASCIQIQKKNINCIFLNQNKLQLFFLIIPNIRVLGSIKILIKVLSLSRFCTYKGYPLSRHSWTSLNDGQIIEQFQQILNVVLYYYIGFENCSMLSRIYYILRYSCAKTLAAKHKTTITDIWKIYNDQMCVYNLGAKINRNTYIVCFVKTNKFDFTRIWHLELLQLDFIAFFITKINSIYILNNIL